VKWAALVALCTFAVLVWAADRGSLPDTLAHTFAFPGGDKLGHFLIAAALTYFTNRASSGRIMRIKSRRFLLGSTLIALIITLEEFSQIFFAYRSYSWLDLGSGYLGIVLTGWLLNNERAL
jgi:VanZ family protein